jgi:hypothetical protein
VALRHHHSPALRRPPPWSALARTLGHARRPEYGPQSRVRRKRLGRHPAPASARRADLDIALKRPQSEESWAQANAEPKCPRHRKRPRRSRTKRPIQMETIWSRRSWPSVAAAPANSERREAKDGHASAAPATTHPRRRRVGAMVGSSASVALRHRSKAWPNPSLKAPTHYGRQRKPGLWPAGILTVRAYAACLRGRL